MARRRRITSGESRWLRRLAADSQLSQRAAANRFRNAGYKIADNLFLLLFQAIRKGFGGNLNKVLTGKDSPLQVSVRGPKKPGKAAIKALGDKIGDAIAGIRVTVRATGFVNGTAQLNLEGRSIEVPWQTPSVTVRWNSRMGLLSTWTAEAQRRILQQGGNKEYNAAVTALRRQSPNFAIAALQYGRIAVGRRDVNVTTLKYDKL